MEKTKMNSVIKFLSERVLAEKPGPKRQILCELLIEELNRVLVTPETSAHEEAPTTTTKREKNKQPVVEENKLIVRTRQANLRASSGEENDPEEGGSSSNQYRTHLTVGRIQIETELNTIKEWEPITFLKYRE